RAGAREVQVHPQPGHALQPLRNGEVVGIGDRDLDGGVAQAIGHGADEVGLRRGQALEQLRCRGEPAQIDVRQSELLGERLRQQLGAHAARAAEPLAELLVAFLRSDARGRGQALLPEDVGEPALLERMPVAHLMTSATWNTGRYMTMMMPPIRMPISSMRSGSISAIARASRVSSTSS